MYAPLPLLLQSTAFAPPLYCLCFSALPPLLLRSTAFALPPWLLHSSAFAPPPYCLHSTQSPLPSFRFLSFVLTELWRVWTHAHCPYIKLLLCQKMGIPFVASWPSQLMSVSPSILDNVLWLGPCLKGCEKKDMSQPGIDPATFQSAAQCITPLATLTWGNYC